jgi:Ca-activated chloride channel family protein
MHSLEYPEALPYAEFGLGVVYLSMEEDQAALERFNASELNAPDDKQLLHRIRYNTGIIRFEPGDFEGAAADFRHSLELDATSVGAKRNLELSLLSLARPRQREPAADPEHETSTRTVVLFEYLREKERDQWKSTEWTETTDQTEPDY